MHKKAFNNPTQDRTKLKRLIWVKQKSHNRKVLTIYIYNVCVFPMHRHFIYNKKCRTFNFWFFLAADMFVLVYSNFDNRQTTDRQQTVL